MQNEIKILPELATGNILVSTRGKTYIVHRVRKPKRNTGFIEPLYRLENEGIIGNAEWTLEELEAAGLKLKGEI